MPLFVAIRHLTFTSCHMWATSAISDIRYWCLKGQSSEILIPFLIYLDRPLRENKTLRALIFLKGSQDFKSEVAFLAWLRRNYFGKIIFFRSFFINSRNLFRIIFLPG
jgi:hypothetical protein